MSSSCGVYAPPGARPRDDCLQLREQPVPYSTSIHWLLAGMLGCWAYVETQWSDPFWLLGMVHRECKFFLLDVTTSVEERGSSCIGMSWPDGQGIALAIV